MILYGLDKEYLSYSAIMLWRRNPAGYRKKYYERVPDRPTAEMQFGKLIAEALERGDEEYSHIPRYVAPEQRFDIAVNGVKLRGFIDTFDPVKRAFREYKTGKIPWTAVKVQKHEQLPFYSLAIEVMEGAVQEKCHLDWIETRLAPPRTIEFNGYELEENNPRRRIELTGKVKSFPRTIEDWERIRIKNIIIEVAKEISEDYERYKKNN